MPIALSSIALQEKNKLAGGAITLVALEITIPGVAEPVRVVSDNQNLTWNGETWAAFNFEIEEINDQAKGEVPRVDLRVANVNRVMEAYIRDYDAYMKANGYSPVTVSIYVVNKAVIDADPDAPPEVEYVFDLKQPKSGQRWATFTLGAPNYYTRRYPLNRILKNSCRYRFKGERCGYAGAETACSHTLARCRELSNSTRFGGAPGVGKGGIDVG
jgi:lambda family phage minor tail protein L